MADHEVDAFGFACIVVVEQQPGFLNENRLAIFVVTILRLARAAHDLLGRNAIDILRVNPHKILPATGHDIGLVTIGPEIVQQLLHGLVGQLGIGALPARMSGVIQPLLYLGLKLLGRHAGQRGNENLFEIRHGKLGDRCAIPGEHGIERLDIFKFRLRLHE